MMTHYEEDIHVTGSPNGPDYKAFIVMVLISLILLIIYKHKNG